jgi:hypothetical protein
VRGKKVEKRSPRDWRVYFYLLSFYRMRIYTFTFFSACRTRYQKWMSMWSISRAVRKVDSQAPQ